MPRGRLWTPEEDALLHEAAAANRRDGTRSTATGSRMRALAERLGRSYDAVLGRASTLGARSFDPDRTARKAEQRTHERRAAREEALDLAGFPRRHSRPWTPEDDATLAARAEDGSGALADRLGSSRRSVQKRANRLGIPLRP